MSKPSAGMLPPQSCSSGCRVASRTAPHTHNSLSLRRHPTKPPGAPIFLQLTNVPSTPQGGQLLYTPSLQLPDTPDSCRKSSSAPQIPAPPPSVRSPCFLYTALLSIPSWLPAQGATAGSWGSFGESASQQTLSRIFSSVWTPS